MGGYPVGDDELFVERSGKRLRAVERVCEHCGQTFLAVRSQVRPGHGRYCSRRCARSRVLAARFWSKVQIGDGCWEWSGTHDPFGYGVLQGSRHERSRKAHRVSWTLHNGLIPDGLWVLHRCDNPPCVNPAHLYLGTAADNARDRAGRGRGRENHQQGMDNPNAKLTEADVKAIIVELQRQPPRSQTAIAEQFGIKQPQVSRIARRESWAHLWDA